MYAIVNIAGQQFKVEKGKKVFVHKLPGNIGDEVSFNKVLLINNDKKVDVGAPYLPNAVVLAQITSHLRGDKVLVFKKKRRKSYQKLNGHRQFFTEIMIEEIAETGAPKKTVKADANEPVEKAAKEPVVAETSAKKAVKEKAVPKSEKKGEKAPEKKASTAKAKPAASKATAKTAKENKTKK
jgi:large subunit ribosomal protein L21